MICACPEENPGALFDEESSDLNPIFVYRFTEADTFPYFCRPHEAMGMKGVVHVQKTFVRGDSSGEGIVDIEACVRALQRISYDGVYAVEHEPEDHDPSEECRAMRGWAAGAYARYQA